MEYRVWNPFRSKLAAGILGGLDDIFIGPGKKVLYLGAASGTSVSHVADVVGPVSFLKDICVYLIMLVGGTRQGQYMLLSSQTGQDAISLIWQRSAPMLFVRLTMFYRV